MAPDFHDPRSEAALKACVCRHVDVGLEDVSVRPIPTGKFNDSYFVNASGRRLVLRVAPPRDAVFCFYERDMMRQEPGIHRLLLERTGIPVAPIVAYDDSHAIVPRDYILMERLPGRPLSGLARAELDRVLERVGDCLAQAHAQRAETYGYIGEHRPMAPCSTWAEAFHTMWNKLIDDVVEVGYYDQAREERFRALLDRHAHLFDHDPPSCLLHMDVWAQNILVDGRGELSGLVDWDRALWGDPEIEFAVLDYCGVSMPAFWRGYGQARNDSAPARVRQIFYLLYEMQKYIVIRAGRSQDPAAARGARRAVESLADDVFGGD